MTLELYTALNANLVAQIDKIKVLKEKLDLEYILCNSPLTKGESYNILIKNKNKELYVWVADIVVEADVDDEDRLKFYYTFVEDSSINDVAMQRVYNLYEDQFDVLDM